MRIHWLASLAFAVLASATWVERAAADPRTERADQLFAEGKRLFDSNLAQACAKFDESLQYNPAAIGTLLNVALCHEKLGRIASAVEKFTEARDRAKEQGLAQHVRAAEQHLVALEPDVPYLSIKLSEPVPETTVLIDERVIAPGALASIAVDPGERVITVSAPDRLPFRTKLIVERAERKDVVVPALARAVTVTSSRRRVGQITTIIGGAATGTAIGLGLYARHLYRAQFGHAMPGDGRCNDDLICEKDGLKQTQRARTLANVATAVGIAGIAVVGVGVYLWFRSSNGAPPDDKKLAIVPHVAPDGIALTALGRF